MRIINVKPVKSEQVVKTIDCFVGNGYLQGAGGSLPDVDTDFQSDRRQEIKEYIEKRYNHNEKQRVFSAGTLTTLKLKAVLKDVARVHRVPVNIVNYITAIFDDDKMTWTDLFKLAATNKKIRDFIIKYPLVIEDIRGLMGQPRSSSIHASALLVTPDRKDDEDLECFDFTPIKKVDGMLVSEVDGYSLDEQGLLKNDCLGIKELSKIKATIDICNDKYNANLTFQGITQSGLDDPKVYQLLKEGHTQNIFQFSSVGMTKFLMSMKPNKIEDLIAANALYRPATLDSGSADKYVTCKLGDAAPVYLWGTYNILKETYGQMVFQEDLAQISREIGGFSLGEGVKLVKLISKKKVDKIKALKDKFMEGALAKGCPKDDAVAIWDMIESGGSYLFNKCIAGYETIHRAKGKHELLTIAEMYKTMHDSKWAEENGHKYLCQKYRRNGYGTGWSLDKNDRLIKNYIKDIRYMGIKPIYRITLENGATIDVTANHKHPTARGIKRTDELVVGVDKMYVNAGYIKSDTSYRFTDKGMRNDPRYHSDKNMEHYELNSKKGHIGFYKRKTNYTQFKFYRENLKKDYCEICGKRDCRLEVHHINKDHSDCGENFSNLQTLCASCHKKAHYQIGRVKQGEKGLDVETIKVVSVEYLKDDEVYDVEMYDPYHTFVTSKGIVTCNSHATAYAITAYVGAFLKANYPSAFYTIALQWADDKEIPSLMSEMEQCSKAKIVHPDINVSDVQFFTDYQNDEIFWSLTRIKMVGVKTVEYIVEERQKNGAFTSIENFIHRIFKYKLKKYEYWDDSDNEEEARKVPVNARHVKHLILAGCFDKIENVKSLPERYRILCVAAKELGFDLKEEDSPSDMTDKHYFWSMLQIEVSGIGSVDYRRIYDNSEAKQHIRGRASYMTIKDAFLKESEGKRIAVCATVLEHDEVEYQDKKTGEKKTFCKLKLQQNNDIIELVMWDDFYKANRDKVIQSKNKMIIVSAIIKYSDYSGCHCLQTYKSSMLFNV